MVQDLLFAPILYGHEDLTGHLLLLVDLLLSFVQISFSIFGVGRSWRGKGWLDWLNSNSFFFGNDGLQILRVHDSKGYHIDVPLDRPLLPSVVGPLEGFRGFELTGFVSRLGKCLSVGNYEVGLDILVQDVHCSHGFDG